MEWREKKERSDWVEVPKNGLHYRGVLRKESETERTNFTFDGKSLFRKALGRTSQSGGGSFRAALTADGRTTGKILEGRITATDSIASRFYRSASSVCSIAIAGSRVFIPSQILSIPLRLTDFFLCDESGSSLFPLSDREGSIEVFGLNTWNNDVSVRINSGVIRTRLFIRGGSAMLLKRLKQKGNSVVSFFILDPQEDIDKYSEEHWLSEVPSEFLIPSGLFVLEEASDLSPLFRKELMSEMCGSSFDLAMSLLGIRLAFPGVSFADVFCNPEWIPLLRATAIPECSVEIVPYHRSSPRGEFSFSEEIFKLGDIFCGLYFCRDSEYFEHSDPEHVKFLYEGIDADPHPGMDEKKWRDIKSRKVRRVDLEQSESLCLLASSLSRSSSIISQRGSSFSGRVGIGKFERQSSWSKETEEVRIPFLSHSMDERGFMISPRDSSLTENSCIVRGQGRRALLFEKGENPVFGRTGSIKFEALSMFHSTMCLYKEAMEGGCELFLAPVTADRVRINRRGLPVLRPGKGASVLTRATETRFSQVYETMAWCVPTDDDEMNFYQCARANSSALAAMDNMQYTLHGFSRSCKKGCISFSFPPLDSICGIPLKKIKGYNYFRLVEERGGLSILASEDIWGENEDFERRILARLILSSDSPVPTFLLEEIYSRKGYLLSQRISELREGNTRTLPCRMKARPIPFSEGSLVEKSLIVKKLFEELEGEKIENEFSAIDTDGTLKSHQLYREVEDGFELAIPSESFSCSSPRDLLKSQGAEFRKGEKRMCLVFAFKGNRSRDPSEEEIYWKGGIFGPSVLCRNHLGEVVLGSILIRQAASLLDQWAINRAKSYGNLLLVKTIRKNGQPELELSEGKIGSVKIGRIGTGQSTFNILAARGLAQKGEYLRIQLFLTDDSLRQKVLERDESLLSEESLDLRRVSEIQAWVSRCRIRAEEEEKRRERLKYHQEERLLDWSLNESQREGVDDWTCEELENIFDVQQSDENTRRNAIPEHFRRCLDSLSSDVLTKLIAQVRVESGVLVSFTLVSPPGGFHLYWQEEAMLWMTDPSRQVRERLLALRVVGMSLSFFCEGAVWTCEQSHPLMEGVWRGMGRSKLFSQLEADRALILESPDIEVYEAEKTAAEYKIFNASKVLCTPSEIGKISFDVEWDPESPRGPVSIQIANSEGVFIWIREKNSLPPFWMMQVLSDSRIIKYGFSIKGDLMRLAELGVPIKENSFFDLIHLLPLFSFEGNSLSDCCRKITGVNIPAGRKEIRLSFSSVICWNNLDEDQLDYMSDDAFATWLLSEVWEERKESPMPDGFRLPIVCNQQFREVLAFSHPSSWGTSTLSSEEGRDGETVKLYNERHSALCDLVEGLDGNLHACNLQFIGSSSPLKVRELNWEVLLHF